MSPAKYGENIKLTLLFSHELYKKVLSVCFSYTLPCIEKILSTFECSWRYGPHLEMEFVSYASSCPQLGMVKILS